MAFDAKQFAGLIVLADDRIEARVAAAHLVAGIGAGHRRTPTNNSSMAATTFLIMRYSSGSVVNSSG